jgi:MAP/microtubule affinity-regulating kinase
LHDTEVRVVCAEGGEYVIPARAELKGTGGFSEVRVARRVPSLTTTAADPAAAAAERVAVKIIQLRPVGKMDERTVLREARIMRQASSLPHPNVLRLLDVHIAHGTAADLTRGHPLAAGADGEAGTAYLFLELCKGGELFDRLTDFGRVHEPNAVRYCAGLLAAVRHVHGRGVIHRDIKLENVLLDAADESVRLADFGLAAELAVDGNGAPINRAARLRDVVGSQSYVAPEILARRKAGYEGPPVDAWSVGVCVFTLLSGFFPLDVADGRDWRFRRLQTEQALGNTAACATIFQMYERECPFSPAARALLDGLLRIDPAARLSVDAALASEWLATATAEPPRPPAKLCVPGAGADAGACAGADDDDVDGDEIVYRSLPEPAAAEALAAGMPRPMRQAAHEASWLAAAPGQTAARAVAGGWRQHVARAPVATALAVLAAAGALALALGARRVRGAGMG